jgi:hypothetical protein
VLQADELPGALSEVSRLDQAEESIREAIAFVADIAPDSFDVEVVPDIPEAARKHLRAVRAHRVEAEHQQQAAAFESREAARELVGAGLSLRDVGTVMGVSHQRAHQLVKD